jgi:hypothetical protein
LRALDEATSRRRRPRVVDGTDDARRALDECLQEVA